MSDAHFLMVQTNPHPPHPHPNHKPNKKCQHQLANTEKTFKFFIQPFNIGDSLTEQLVVIVQQKHILSGCSFSLWFVLLCSGGMLAPRTRETFQGFNLFTHSSLNIIDSHSQSMP